MNEQETIQEKAILVGCQLPHITDEHFENSMEEPSISDENSRRKSTDQRHTKTEQG